MLECFACLTPEWLKRAHFYSGSVGPFCRDFRYRWETDGDKQLICAAVYSRVCYEKADDVEVREFAWDEAGVESLKQWLQSSCDRFFAAHPLPEEGQPC